MNVARSTRIQLQKIVLLLNEMKSLATEVHRPSWGEAMTSCLESVCGTLGKNEARQEEQHSVCLALLFIDEVLHGVHLELVAHIWP